MALDAGSVASRRRILAAAFGGLGAFVAGALGRPALVDAANGATVTVGGTFDGTTPTTIRTTGGVDAIVAQNQGTAASGLFGFASATSGTTYGVFGRSNSDGGTGVAGVDYVTTASGTKGVYGESRSPLGSGVYGFNPATSGNPNGVYGETKAPHGAGVHGFNNAGSDGPAVMGETGVGYGVLGKATSGIGVLAYASSGLALRVSGRAQFSRSGRASIPKNKTSVDVTVPGGLGSSANVLATLQASRSGVWVRAVRRNYPTTGVARIYLNKVASTSASTPVAWFVID